MDWRIRIVIDPKILAGKPVIRGARISVQFVVELLAAGWSHEQVLASYPHIFEQDILACLAYAGELLGRNKFIACHSMKFLADENFPRPAVLDDYVERFQQRRAFYDRMIFAVDSPTEGLAAPAQLTTVQIWTCERVAELVVRLGLGEWVESRPG